MTLEFLTNVLHIILIVFVFGVYFSGVTRLESDEGTTSTGPSFEIYLRRNVLWFTGELIDV